MKLISETEHDIFLYKLHEYRISTYHGQINRFVENLSYISISAFGMERNK